MCLLRILQSGRFFFIAFHYITVGFLWDKRILYKRFLLYNEQTQYAFQDHLVFESHPLLPHLDEHQQLIVHQHQELQRYPMEQGESVHQPLPQNPP